MSRIGTNLSQVLIGALDDSADPAGLRAAVVAAGKDPADLLVLAGEAGRDELLAHDRRSSIGGWLNHLARHVEELDGGGTGHVVRSAGDDLRAGNTVIVLRHVSRAAAAPMAEVLDRAGVPHVHYIGKWTVAEGGAIPADRITTGT